MNHVKKQISNDVNNSSTNAVLEYDIQKALQWDA